MKKDKIKLLLLIGYITSTSYTLHIQVLNIYKIHKINDNKKYAIKRFSICINMHVKTFQFSCRVKNLELKRIFINKTLPLYCFIFIFLHS